MSYEDKLNKRIAALTSVSNELKKLFLQIKEAPEPEAFQDQILMMLGAAQRQVDLHLRDLDLRVMTRKMNR